MHQIRENQQIGNGNIRWSINENTSKITIVALYIISVIGLSMTCSLSMAIIIPLIIGVSLYEIFFRSTGDRPQHNRNHYNMQSPRRRMSDPIIYLNTHVSRNYNYPIIPDVLDGINRNLRFYHHRQHQQTIVADQQRARVGNVENDRQFSGAPSTLGGIQDQNLIFYPQLQQPVENDRQFSGTPSALGGIRDQNLMFSPQLQQATVTNQQRARVGDGNSFSGDPVQNDEQTNKRATVGQKQ